MPDYNSMLFRKIRDGNDYDNLIPRSYCKPLYVGEGLTDFTINAMEEGILEYAWQTEKLADVLQKQTLNSTALTIHEFLYNHFQYHADKSDQMLRSPACSWYTRKEGIDCKSYSIFASCLLLNMGITHYIRKIKQAGDSPDHYTHVYVIVPNDQSNGTLGKGYYTIDGTLKYTQEPSFIGKSDLKMEGMKHYFLNGTVFQGEGYSYMDLNGLNGGISLSGLKDLSKSINLKSLKSVWSAIDCIGGSGFTESMSKTSLANIDLFYQDWSLRFNTAIMQDNMQLASALYAEFKGRSMAWLAASEKKKTQGYNSCTTKRIQGNIVAFKFYKEVVGGVLDAYMAKYFNPVSGTFPQTATFSNEGSEQAPFGFHYTYTEPYFVNNQPKQMFAPDITVSIPAFVLPQYVVDQANAGKPVDLATVLNLIETAGNIIKTVAPVKNPTSPTSPIKTPIKNLPGGTKYTNLTPIGGQTKTAGFSGILGWGIALVSLAVAFGKMKDNGKGAAPSRQPKKLPIKNTK